MLFRFSDFIIPHKNKIFVKFSFLTEILYPLCYNESTKGRGDRIDSIEKSRITGCAARLRSRDAVLRSLARRGGFRAEQGDTTVLGVCGNWITKMRRRKKKSGVSQFLSRFRGLFQAGATLLTNLHLPNFLKGSIYQGKGKAVCVPGLNCYSCPAASGACPIGSFQAVVGSSKFSFSYYITGFLILLGVLLGRFICGLLCPFGWLQELLHKIPTKKISTKKLKPLTYIKYAVLLFMVILLPMLITNDVGMGDPFFCKYLCPQGVLEGAIPLAAVNSGIRAALGALFSWKLGILVTVILLSVLFYRPFCKWLCPLGAFYALLNKVSLFGMKVDKHKCVSCGKCAKACKMDVDVTKTPDHTECIRCGMCVRACPTKAVSFRYGFGREKDDDRPAEKAEPAKIISDIEKE